jgi:hypothetical protein
MKNLGRLDDALDKYTECAAIFKLRFGTSDPMYRDCVAMLDKVQTELGGVAKKSSGPSKQKISSPYPPSSSNMEEGGGEGLMSLVEVKP